MKTTRAVLPVSMWSVNVDVGEAVSAYLASEYHLPERLEGRETGHSPRIVGSASQPGVTRGAKCSPYGPGRMGCGMVKWHPAGWVDDM